KRQFWRAVYGRKFFAAGRADSPLRRPPPWGRQCPPYVSPRERGRPCRARPTTIFQRRVRTPARLVDGLFSGFDDRSVAFDIVINSDAVVVDELGAQILKLLLGVARESKVARWQQASVEHAESLLHAGVGSSQVDVRTDRHG